MAFRFLRAIPLFCRQFLVANFGIRFMLSTPQNPSKSLMLLSYTIFIKLHRHSAASISNIHFLYMSCKISNATQDMVLLIFLLRNRLLFMVLPDTFILFYSSILICPLSQKACLMECLAGFPYSSLYVNLFMYQLILI